MKQIKNYPVRVDNKLPDDDQRLLDTLDTFCVSAKEREFIEQMLEIEQHWETEVGASVILEDENDDHLYIMHYNNSEYEIGNESQNSVYVAFSLSELLGLYLDEQEILDRHITVLEWLRQIGYENVTYDRTRDAK